MTKDDQDRLIRAAWTVAVAPLADLRAAARDARYGAANVHPDPTSEHEHFDADLSIIASLTAAAEMLDLLVTYRTVQSWTEGDDPIDLGHPATNGDNHNHT